MPRVPVIALDGPSGVGKSTTARAVAQVLGWQYLDTGAMYRAAALALQREAGALEDPVIRGALLARLVVDQQGSRTFLGHEDVSEAIRTPELSRLASVVSAFPEVREVLVAQQRRIGRAGRGCVVDGRDIGTVVFPDACCKIYLTATVEERARRRFLELQGQGAGQSLGEVAEDIRRRDHADMNRAVAPLRRAEDALELDSSGLSLDQVVAEIVARHHRHG